MWMQSKTDILCNVCYFHETSLSRFLTSGSRGEDSPVFRILALYFLAHHRYSMLVWYVSNVSHQQFYNTCCTMFIHYNTSSLSLQEPAAGVVAWHLLGWDHCSRPLQPKINSHFLQPLGDFFSHLRGIFWTFPNPKQGSFVPKPNQTVSTVLSQHKTENWKVKFENFQHVHGLQKCTVPTLILATGLVQTD